MLFAGQTYVGLYGLYIFVQVEGELVCYLLSYICWIVCSVDICTCRGRISMLFAGHMYVGLYVLSYLYRWREN